jgi:hypothetical protein
MIISQPVELIARTGRSAELGELGRQASDKRGAGRCDLDLRGHCPGPGVLRGTVNRRDRPRAADVQAGMRVVGIPKAIRPVLQDHVSRFAGLAPAALVFPGAKGGPLRRGNCGTRETHSPNRQRCGASGFDGADGT